ncbi:type I restriction endonuclease [Chitinophaga nivalis]|uniref:Type I restriction endonuclease n=1 Tax=Chitinophaga nivalis TaxID=2991709 RepID=A0ABT3IVJ5_9BACT|nr:type I restriction endonuclease [Chitinophaga nivalis]MCW3462605.1 type I restriction endonuclease [Chitinophaga nivalis]MCW3487704.1 type I restriction endonuclease [Chitinophaga nivalis]
MDFKDLIKQLAERILKHKELVQTEEATKHSFVMPFLQTLGYDVFNPLEVVPEFIADLGIKKGEKVDYAIMKDGQPLILIECKHWSANLDPHNSQLFRYFHTTKAKFSILTNGFESRFYTDLDEPNKMDEKPFFVFDLNDIKDNQLEELKKFHKNYFDTDTIVSTASELKYLNQLKSLFSNELNNPGIEFVKHFARQVYTSGILTQKVLEQFTQLSKKAFQIHINDLITERLKTALKTEEAEQQSTAVAVEIAPEEPKVVTTQEELDGYHIVRSILRKIVPVHKIHYRDAQSYFAILFEDNNRKPICRLYFNTNRKQIGLFDANKAETKKDLQSLDSLFEFTDELIGTLQNYVSNKVASATE